jgi:hypothetical protein
VLVQRAQQSILNMELETDIEHLGSGHLSLSAKLAAYGENLALKRAEEERNGDPQVLEDGALTTQIVFTRDSSRRPCIRDIRALESSGITNQSRGSANQDGPLLVIAVCTFTNTTTTIIISNLFSTTCQICFAT